jgi:hypothetical protein
MVRLQQAHVRRAEAVLAYLSRYTHRVAVSNSRLIVCDGNGVTCKVKDYRAIRRKRQKIMTLAADETEGESVGDAWIILDAEVRA